MGNVFGWLSRIFGPAPAAPFERLPYSVFTREFDQVVDAQRLDTVLGPDYYSVELEEAWATFSKGLIAWRTSVQVRALEVSQRIRRVVSQDDLSKTTVSILVDQSGSMRGQSMLLAAATADIASEFLVHLGPSVEVLGFTTCSWHGGKSRKKWERSGSPRQPGRLCDLLHIIYRSVEDRRASTEGPTFKPMLRPDLPKENVDGEAVEWAASRLRQRPQRTKILLVISDGAPVDDSTLQVNHSHILEDHVIAVVHALEEASDIRVAAIGIGFDVSRYYGNASTVKVPEDLGVAVIDQLERLLLPPLSAMPSEAEA